MYSNALQATRDDCSRESFRNEPRRDEGLPHHGRHDESIV